MGKFSVVIMVTILTTIFYPSQTLAQNSTSENSFKIFENQILVGGDYRKSKPGKVNRSRCEKTCARISSCKAFTYDADVRICHIKNRITHFQKSPGATTGIRSSIQAPPVNPCSAEIFSQAVRSRSKLKLQGFLDGCPNGQRADKAKLALTALIQKGDWLTAKQTDTCQSFEDFLKKHPSRKGPYFHDAIFHKGEKCQSEETRKREILERKNWRTAAIANSCKAYRKFLKQHPSNNGFYYSKAVEGRKNKCTNSCDKDPLCIIKKYYIALDRRRTSKAASYWHEPSDWKITLMKSTTGAKLVDTKIENKSTFDASVAVSVRMKSKGTDWENWRVQIKMINTGNGWKIRKICAYACEEEE